MQKETTNISPRRRTRNWLRDCLTLLIEAFIWGISIYAAALSQGLGPGVISLFIWLVLIGWGIVFLFIVTRFIPNNAYSRTARRDEVVACAIKTALAFAVLSFVVFSERTSFQVLSCLYFCVALTAERLILNSWFIRYCIRHREQGVLICNEETAWQQQALQQNTYGLKLVRLEQQTAQMLEEHLAEHPETESVYLAPSSLPAAEVEDIAHTCRKQGIMLHFLPQPVSALNKAMRSECRGSVSVLSPAKFPLQSIEGRSIKRLTDIVLSLLVLLTVFPVFALIAFICIKRQSRGPVLIARHLCGMDGKPFLCFTFRTRHFEAAPSFFEGTGDPGYFPFGKFLKRSRLELLPEFLCVLWGSMTIVGSQAMQPEQYTDYRRELRQNFVSGHHLKAGITSSHPSSQTQGSVKDDVWYYRNWGFWLDLRIMFQRLRTLLNNSKAKSINYI